MEGENMKYLTDVTKMLPVVEAKPNVAEENKAIAKMGKYSWHRISFFDHEAYYACIDGDTCTVIRVIGEDGDMQLGCACGKTNDSFCEHLYAFRMLKNPPQGKPERWLEGWLLDGEGWRLKNGQLAPPRKEPEVVAELPPLNIPDSEDVDGQDAEARKAHICKGCGAEFADIDALLAHIETCDAVNMAKARKVEEKTNSLKRVQGLAERVGMIEDGEVDPDEHEPVPEPERKPSVPEPKPTPEPKPHICKICGKECKDIDDLLNHQERCKQKQINEKEEETLPALLADMEWSASQIEVMRKTVAVGTTMEEFAYFLNVAKAAGLNPFLREVYCWKSERTGQLTIATGRDGYLAIAKRDPRFRGLQSMEVCENDEFEMEFVGGQLTIKTHKIVDFKNRGKVIGAWARAEFEGQDPIVAYASRDEYDTKKNVWIRNPSAMMRKVPEAIVLKRGAGISGLVTEAEVESPHIIDAEVL